MELKLIIFCVVLSAGSVVAMKRSFSSLPFSEGNVAMPQASHESVGQKKRCRKMPFERTFISRSEGYFDYFLALSDCLKAIKQDEPGAKDMLVEIAQVMVKAEKERRKMISLYIQ